MTSIKGRIQTLTMRGIVKRFPGVLAVNQVDFEARAGEIHALLGENGAGKSTLMKILYGLYSAEEGQILINGKPVQIRSPQESIALGIGMIHQHFMLVPSLTVAENVALGMKSSRGWRLDLDRVERELLKLSEQYHLKVDPRAPIWQLSVGEQQRVEILRAVYKGAELLILDEPTAVLTPQEVDDLFGILRQMTDDGRALIFISHKLNEVLAISQHISVLRDGQKVASIPTKGATKTSLAEMMVGRPVVLEYERGQAQKGAEALVLREVSALSERGDVGLNRASFSVAQGELVGVAGVSGNGQRELAEVIAGLRQVTSGEIRLSGRSATHESPSQRHAQGLAYIPEERMTDGAIKQFTVAENYILRDFSQAPYSQKGFMRFRQIEVACQQAISDYDIKTPDSATPLKYLSGGNIQKLILARELARRPKVMLAAQPTRGVDIGATEYIHQRLLEQRAQGTAILLISEDLDEIMAISDRILVMYEGRIVGDVPRQEATLQNIGVLMAGGTLEKT
jgi:ABC-type uncharacterized transport system ATPase subunit